MATRTAALQGERGRTIRRIRAAVAFMLVLALSFGLGGATASAVTSVAGPTATTTATTYEAGLHHSAATVDSGFLGDGLRTPTEQPAIPAADEVLGARSVFVAAETAGDVGTAVARSDLAGGQASNFARYSKKLPSGAQEPVITRGANGSVQFSADVPGRVPGSYATYTKVVDSGGTTTDYFTTTVAPDGSIVHVKIKFP